MLRPLRRRLALIRYYSASREATVWTRSADAAVFVTLALAVPMVVLCDAVVTRPFVAVEQQGTLNRASGGGNVTARLAAADGSAFWSRETFGNFTLQRIEESRGWPMATSRHAHPLRIEYDLFHEPSKRVDARAADDEPLRNAIGAALDRGDHATLLATWQLDAPTRANEPLLRWVFGAALWWVFLYVAAMLMIAAARVLAAVWERQSALRAKRLIRTGRCAYCGYDLRGTEFSERCPECGELAG